MFFRKIGGFLAIVLLAAFAISSFSSYQQIALYACLPTAFCLSFLSIPNKRIPKPLIQFLFLFFWEGITTLTALNLHLAVNELIRMVATILMIYSITQLSKNQHWIPWLYIVFVVYYLAMCYYAYTHILTVDYDYTSERLDDDVLGANSVAYFTFFTTFIIYIFPSLLHKERVKSFLKFLFLLSPFWSFAIAILTGSRQVIVIQFPLIFILLYLRYVRGQRTSRKLMFGLACIVVFAIAVIKLGDIYESSLLFQRSQLALEEDVRANHLRYALQTGFSHPIFGVGPGNYGMYIFHHSTFSHCTYLELFANTGLIGLSIFLVLIFGAITKQFRKFKETRDSFFLVMWVFMCAYAVDNLFYVFHTSPWLMSFFFLTYMHSEYYYESNYLKVKYEN